MRTRHRTWHTRIGPGFSLDEAARIRKQMTQVARGTLTCPHCGSFLQEITGPGVGERVSLVLCDGCGRSLVLREANSELRSK